MELKFASLLLLVSLRKRANSGCLHRASAPIWRPQPHSEDILFGITSKENTKQLSMCRRSHCSTLYSVHARTFSFVLSLWLCLCLFSLIISPFYHFNYILCAHRITTSYYMWAFNNNKKLYPLSKWKCFWHAYLCSFYHQQQTLTHSLPLHQRFSYVCDRGCMSSQIARTNQPIHTATGCWFILIYISFRFILKISISLVYN